MSDKNTVKSTLWPDAGVDQNFQRDFRGSKKGVFFQKGGIGRCSSVPKFSPKSLLCSASLAEESYDLIFLDPKNRKQGTVAKTTLL